MGNEWRGRLRLITFFDLETRNYYLRQMSEELPMPRVGSKVYENREGLLFAFGRENGKIYTDLLRVSDFNSDTVYDWVPLNDNVEIKNNLAKLNEENYFEELNFEDDGDFFNNGFQGAD